MEHIQQTDWLMLFLKLVSATALGYLIGMEDSEIARFIVEGGLFPLRPGDIEQQLQLRQPIYEQTAAYGHVGRTPRTVTKTFFDANGHEHQRTVELFTWEKLDKVAQIKDHCFRS